MVLIHVKVLILFSSCSYFLLFLFTFNCHNFFLELNYKNLTNIYDEFFHHVNMQKFTINNTVFEYLKYFI